MTIAPGVVLDSGAFIAAERRSGTMVALAQRLTSSKTPLVTSAGVAAQVWRGGGHRQVPVAYLLRHTSVIKKLSAVGNSLGLIIERPILELLDITKDTPLEVKTDGEALIIRRAKLSKKERVRESTKRMMSVHDETLRKLAK